MIKLFDDLTRSREINCSGFKNIDVTLEKSTWIISAAQQSSINNIGGMVKFLDNKDDYSTKIILIIINWITRAVYSFNWKEPEWLKTFNLKLDNTNAIVELDDQWLKKNEEVNEKGKDKEVSIEDRFEFHRVNDSCIQRLDDKVIEEFEPNEHNKRKKNRYTEQNSAPKAQRRIKRIFLFND
ncbi:hypothetical protein GLOIN_2v1471210 [Rhizophagus clarus]|uniref:Uncharacterized protein n=1 Tax=Rhizophagus clarus TaxID=94130 RepID=A0A8H3LGD7_9GLOM|nr:hypothetical protein GLOIN_2v1471210 [Rhizophagus clarus]